MEVKINLSRADLFLMNLHAFPRMKSNWIFFLVLWAGFLVFHIFTEGVPENAWKVLFLIFSYGVGAVAAMIVIFIWSAAWVLIASNKRSGVLGEHEYKIVDDGLFEKTHANETLTRWSSIVSIRKTGRFILVRISSWLCHTIPKAAFSTEDEYDQFYEVLVSKWKAKVQEFV